MATKKKAAATPVDVPSFLLEEDANKTVTRTSAALAKKWSLTRKESLVDAARLGWFYVALGRDREARELVEHVCERVTFTGDAEVWAAASQSIAIAARLARLRGDDEQRASLVARLVAHPAVVAGSREVLIKALAEPTKDIRSAEVESAAKWALEGFARGCARAAYLRETAAEGAYAAGVIDVAALDATVEEGLAGLRAYLAR
jgi:hypothetical protein